MERVQGTTMGTSVGMTTRGRGTPVTHLCLGCPVVDQYSTVGLPGFVQRQVILISNVIFVSLSFGR